MHLFDDRIFQIRHTLRSRAQLELVDPLQSLAIFIGLVAGYVLYSAGSATDAVASTTIHGAQADAEFARLAPGVSACTGLLGGNAPPGSLRG
ncbi:hypothetical protein C9E91_15215 [Rhizobium sp. SEMIA4064]|nr:hypothetical protein C9E91_15215 [Rhizobium sp. SEMIA4064]